ncbi:MAG: cellulase family glycosylhydrolase [Bacteroidota bacterium]
MNKLTKLLVIFIFLDFFSSYTINTLQGQTKEKREQNHGFTNVYENEQEWWNIPYPDRFDQSVLKPQSKLSIKENLLVDEKDSKVVLKGFNVADISKLKLNKQWNEHLFKELKDWGTNVVRIPIHPLSWRKHGKQWYFERLDEAVVWANKLGMYLIIDWHSIGNLKTAMYQHPMYVTTVNETMEFWRDISFRYKSVPTMAVYELFNEPTHDFIGNGAGSLGKITWEEWRELLESIVDIVQVYDPEVVCLVTGFNWGYDLSQVMEHPIRRAQIAYAIHPYPQKAKVQEETIKNFQTKWQEQWGYVADKYPLMATEFGWVKEDGYGAHVPVIHNGNTYGPAIIDFMKSRNISWTAWVFDPDWSPVIINDWDFTPSEQGAYLKSVLQEKE